MKPPLPEPHHTALVFVAHRENKSPVESYFTEAQLLAYRDAMIEMCLSLYSPDDTATDWADKMRELK